MTAEMARKIAVNGAWETLRKLKDRWVLAVFLAGGVFWIRDAFEEFASLPGLVRQQTEALAALNVTMTRLKDELEMRLSGDHSPVLGFPGARHIVDDGTPGAWTVLHWSPVRRLRADCTPMRIDAFMIDREGRWFSVETSMTPMPVVEGDADVAFGIKVPPAMEPGRARAGAQVTSDCRTHLQVESTPWLPFRVLEG